MKDLEIASLKEQLKAAEVGLRQDDEEWRMDCNALKEQIDSLKEANNELHKDKKLLEDKIDSLKEANNELDKDKKLLEDKIDSLKEANNELHKDKKLLEHEVDDFKDRVKAAELALEKDDEEWRQDYCEIYKENKSLKEETDSLKQEIQSLRQEKDTLKIEYDVIKGKNEALSIEKENISQSHKNHLDAVLLSHEKDYEEWKFNYQSLTNKCDSLMVQNDKLLKQQLEVALMGRRASIEKMETTVQTMQQENAVLKVVREEADTEIMLLNNDKSILNQKVVSLEEQLQNKEKELNIANETATKFINMKSKMEEEHRVTVDKLNQKIELLEQERVKLKHTHSISTRIDHSSHSDAAVNQDTKSFTSETHSDKIKETDDTSNKTEHLLTSSPIQSLSASLFQSHSTNISITSSETTFDHSILQATASLELSSTRDVVDQDSLVSNSLPSLHGINTSYTTPLYTRKSVSTAGGEDAVMCKQFTDVANLFCGQRVIIQRINDSYEYGIVRAFPECINGNMNFVGIELDLPSMFSKIP